MKVLGWVLAFAVFWVFADATSGKNTIGVTAKQSNRRRDSLVVLRPSTDG